MDDYKEELRRQSEREEIRYRRELAIRRRKARTRRTIFLAALVFILIAAAAAIIIVSARRTSPGEPDAPDSPEEPEAGNNPDTIAVPDWVTVDLLPVNEYSRPGTALEQVNGVVVHYVGNPNTTAKQNRNYFANLAQTHETSASSHFLIGLDGEVIQCVPLNEWSYCSNSRNADTIAIECCHPDESGEFTKETYDSLIKLLKWLCDTYSLDREDIIRHYDVTGKICPKWYVDHPEDWEALLDDVGAPSNPDKADGADTVEDEDKDEGDRSGGFLSGLLDGLK